MFLTTYAIKMLNLILVAVLFHYGSCQQTYYMEENCGQYVNMTGDLAYLKLTRNAQYKTNEQCNMYLVAPEGKMVLVAFQKVDFEPGPTDDTCQVSGDELALYKGTDLSFRDKIGDNVCGLKAPKFGYKSGGNIMTLRFTSDFTMTGSGFDATLTVYHEAPCSEAEFKCDNNACIAKKYAEDNMNHCGDESDVNKGLSTGAIVGIVIGAIAFVIIVALLVFCCCCRD